MNEVAERFGENLRRLRKGTGISQEDLGYRCSLHRTEIGLLERGARVPRIDCALLAGIIWEPGTTTMRTGSFASASPASSEERADGGGRAAPQPK